MALITDELRGWIGRTQPIGPIEITRNDIVKYSLATQQRSATYLRGDEAPPLFLFGALRPLVSIDELGPDGLAGDPLVPKLPLERVMAGGSKIRFHRAVKPGDILVGERELHEIYEKHGASGPLLFIVYKITLTIDGGELVLEETQTRIAR